MMRLGALLALVACVATPVGGSVRSRRHGSVQLRRGGGPIIGTPHVVPAGGTAEPAPGAAPEAAETKAPEPAEPEKAEPEKAEEKREEAKSEGGGVAGGEEAGKCVALIVFVLVCLASPLYAMTQTTRPHVGNATVLVIDNIIAIFVAVLWFQGFNDLTHILPHMHHRVFLSVAHAVMMIMTFAGIAWATRYKATTIAILCGVGAHFCAFSSGHASLSVQAHFFKDHPIMCLVGFFLVFGTCVALGAVSYQIKRAMGMNPGVETSDEGHNTFIDRFDDVETDFGAMAMAMYWVMVVQFSIMGQWPDPDIDPGTPPDHSAMDRYMMLAYVAVIFLAGPTILGKLGARGDVGYFKGRVVGLLTSFIAMSIAFGFLTWGKMMFYEHEAMSMSPIAARIMFAALCSVTTMAGILFVTSRAPTDAGGFAMLTGLGLISGFAWEEVFDAAVEGIVEGTPHEHFAKAIIAVVGALVVLPTYAFFVKPKSFKAAEEEGA
mmetsp:Transcript_103968/g.324108  ORF Transcript_103968/g.324108 Transcript_103968/m.324108 type:complete len:491 (-) Transcript_103968:162-1634(-)